MTSATLREGFQRWHQTFIDPEFRTLDRNIASLQRGAAYKSHYEEIRKVVLRAIRNQDTSLKITLNQRDVEEEGMNVLDHHHFRNNLKDLSILAWESEKCIPSFISQLKKLERLYITGKLTFISRGILKCEHLTALTLRISKLTTFPEVLRWLPHLTELDVSHNQISNVPDWVGYLPLTSLNLSNNRIKDLPSTLGNLKNLKELDVDQNPLETLPFNIAYCQSLVTLNADSIFPASAAYLLNLSKNEGPLQRGALHEAINNAGLVAMSREASLDWRHQKSAQAVTDFVFGSSQFGKKLVSLSLHANVIFDGISPSISNLKNLKKLAFYGDLRCLDVLSYKSPDAGTKGTDTSNEKV